MVGERQRKVFDLLRRAVLREGVYGVFHRVGGQNAGVVTLGVSGLEISLEPDRNRQVPDVMPSPVPDELDETDSGFSVTVAPEHQVPRYVE
jgi:hypothetical protein